MNASILSKQQWQLWATKLKQQARALYFTWKNPDTPKAIKCLAFITIAYLFSPIDLIPDFIPVLGFVDDILLLPLLCWLVIKLIPDVIWQHSLKLAQSQRIDIQFRWMRPVIITIWLLLSVAVCVSLYILYFPTR